MKVAVRSSQHSPMFGQRASSQTEWRFHSFIRPFRRRYCGPPGVRTLSHGGLGESVGRNGSTRGRDTPITLILREFLGGIMAHLSQAANVGAPQQKKDTRQGAVSRKYWCRRGDSNPHGLPHTPLKRARLPVPPLRPEFGVCHHFRDRANLPTAWRSLGSRASRIPSP